LTTRDLGDAAEDLAANHLTRLGFRIVARQFRVRGGEIDLVARDGGTLCFVEVRSRKDDGHGAPEETVGAIKQRRVITAARAWLAKHPTDDPCRFDVVAIVDGPGQKSIKLFKNAFDAS
jgi:putative endonuclease